MTLHKKDFSLQVIRGLLFLRNFLVLAIISYFWFLIGAWLSGKRYLPLAEFFQAINPFN